MKEIYKKNSERVSAEIVTVIRNTMRTRIMGKIKPGNNSSTFTLRMLFKYVDTNHFHGRGDGRLNMNDFSEMLMMFGMQLNKTDTAAIFAYYDKEFMGSIDIDMFMKDMVDEVSAWDTPALSSRSSLAEPANPTQLRGFFHAP